MCFSRFGVVESSWIPPVLNVFLSPLAVRTFKFLLRLNPLPVIVTVVPPSFGPAMGVMDRKTGGAAA
jgi:hypothetical protein